MPSWCVAIIAVIILITGIRLIVVAEERIWLERAGKFLVAIGIGAFIWFFTALIFSPMIPTGKYYAVQEINCADGGKIQVISTDSEGIINVTRQFNKTLDIHKRVYRKFAAPCLGICDFGYYTWCYEE